MPSYHKLIRDRIPDIIRGRGATPITHVADVAEYRRALQEKMVEEAGELAVVDGADPAQFTEEMADCLEVLRALAASHDIPWERVEHEAFRKVRERGAFTERIILERVEGDTGAWLSGRASA